MRPTQELSHEHEAIKRMLAVVSEICDRVEAGKPFDAGHLDSAVEFIRTFADKCHHGKEEDFLFPAMVQAGIPREGGPIGVMIAEHVIGREFVKNLADALPAFRAGESRAKETVLKNARGYVSLLAPHIHKEDFILYPMADRVLTSGTQEALTKSFAKVEDEIVGHGVHERFYKLLDDLEAFYRAVPKPGKGAPHASRAI
jgi:hemerythrin-like domain-containing protein